MLAFRSGRLDPCRQNNTPLPSVDIVVMSARLFRATDSFVSF